MQQIEGNAQQLPTQASCEEFCHNMALPTESIQPQQEYYHTENESNDVNLKDIMEFEGELVLKGIQSTDRWISIDKPNVIINDNARVIT